MNVLDDLGSRLAGILEELEGQDLREPFRREQLLKICRKAYPLEHDMTIIGLVDELYIRVFNHD